MTLSGYLAACGIVGIPVRSSPPLSIAALEALEFEFNGVRLPNEFREFLLVSDGCEFCDLDVLPARGIHGAGDLLCFQNWGNGDFDCFRIDGKSARPEVIFMNHNPGATHRVSPSFEAWLKAIAAEWQKYGDILHPGDYREIERPDGVYARVLASLARTDCELNR